MADEWTADKWLGRFEKAGCYLRMDKHALWPIPEHQETAPGRAALWAEITGTTFEALERRRQVRADLSESSGGFVGCTDFPNPRQSRS